MTGRTLEILPFGLLPFFFFIGCILWYRASDGTEKHIAKKVRYGITEFPNDISMLLAGDAAKNIEFAKQGNGVVLAVGGAAYWGIDDEASAKAFIQEQLASRDYRDDVNADLIACHVVESVTVDKEHDSARILVTLPNDVVRSKQYIAHEMQHLGRVFKRNDVNGVRWLLYPQGERRVMFEKGRVLVHVDRAQLVPGFMGDNLITMSERQITRNIRNRLWNRFEVRCLEIDEKTYRGEILLA